MNTSKFYSVVDLDNSLQTNDKIIVTEKIEGIFTSIGYDGNNILNDYKHSNIIFDKLKRIYQIFKKNCYINGYFFGNSLSNDFHYNTNLDFLTYSITIDDKFLTNAEFLNICDNLNIKPISVLYKGKFDIDIINSLINGKTTINKASHKKRGIILESPNSIYINNTKCLFQLQG